MGPQLFCPLLPVRSIKAHEQPLPERRAASWQGVHDLYSAASACRMDDAGCEILDQKCFHCRYETNLLNTAAQVSACPRHSPYNVAASCQSCHPGAGCVTFTIVKQQYALRQCRENHDCRRLQRPARVRHRDQENPPTSSLFVSAIDLVLPLWRVWLLLHFAGSMENCLDT